MDAWWLYRLKSKPDGKAHIGRKWLPDSDKIGLLCSKVFFAEDLSEEHPSYPHVVICGNCERVAKRNGIEIGGNQPRLK